MQRLSLLVAAWWLAAIVVPSAASADDIVIRIRDQEAGMYRSPDHESEVMRVVYEGDKFVAVTTVKDFYLVKDIETGSFFYIPFFVADELIDELPENIHVSGEMPFPDYQDLSYWHVAPSRIYTKLRSTPPEGMLSAHNGKSYPAKYSYNDDYITKVDGSELVKMAMGFMDTKYVLGGTTKEGIDCSGLTKVCLARQGIDVVHRSSIQALEGKYIQYDSLRAGDLVFFRDAKDSRYLSHVGIYIGGNKFVHASQSNGKVVVTSLLDKYFKSHYAFARRL